MENLEDFVGFILQVTAGNARSSRFHQFLKVPWCAMGCGGSFNRPLLTWVWLKMNAQNCAFWSTCNTVSDNFIEILILGYLYIRNETAISYGTTSRSTPSGKSGSEFYQKMLKKTSQAAWNPHGKSWNPPLKAQWWVKSWVKSFEAMCLRPCHPWHPHRPRRVWAAWRCWRSALDGSWLDFPMVGTMSSCFFGKRRLVGTMFLDHFFLRWRKAAWDILHPKSRIHHSPFIHKSFCREKRMILPRLTFPDLVKGKVCTNPWSTLLCYGFRSKISLRWETIQWLSYVPLQWVVTIPWHLNVPW